MNTESYALIERTRVIEACMKWAKDRNEEVARRKSAYIDELMEGFWVKLFKRTRESVVKEQANETWSRYNMLDNLWHHDMVDVIRLHSLCEVSTEEKVYLSATHASILSDFLVEDEG